jgi:hypothetical protein
MPHVWDLPDQPQGPFEDPDKEGVRFWLSPEQLRKIERVGASVRADLSVELEWRGAGYYMARVYDPDTREIAAEQLIWAQETQ